MKNIFLALLTMGTVISSNASSLDVEKCSKDGGLCIGTDVILTLNGSFEAGTVSGFMKNGDVITTTKKARRVTNPKSLALRSGCTPDDYCVGDQVISDDYRDILRNHNNRELTYPLGPNTGLVRAIFHNGDVVVSINDFFQRRSTNVLSITNESPSYRD